MSEGARVLTLAASRGRRTVYTLTGGDGARRLSSHVEYTPADPQRFRARLVSVPLDTVAYEELSAGAFLMEPSDPQELVRIVSVQGGVLHVGAQERPLGPGEVTAFDTSLPFRLSAREPVRVATAIIPRHLLRLPSDALAASSLAPITSSLRPAWSALMRSLAESAPDDGTPEAELLARTVVDLSRGLLATDADTDSVDATLRRAREIIDREYADASLRASGIAHALGISERRLHRLFRDEELTVSQSIRKRRAEAAARRLLLSSDSFETIAARVGFGSSDSAFRSFRAFLGASPAQYRAEAQRASPEKPHYPSGSTAVRAESAGE